VLQSYTAKRVYNQIIPAGTKWKAGIQILTFYGFLISSASWRIRQEC